MSRLEKAIRRRLRRRRELRRIRHRQVMALEFNLYECVGGPFDGEMVNWIGILYFRSVRVRGGIYRPGEDWRLHFYALQRAAVQ